MHARFQVDHAENTVEVVATLSGFRQRALYILQRTSVHQKIIHKHSIILSSCVSHESVFKIDGKRKQPYVVSWLDSLPDLADSEWFDGRKLRAMFFFVLHAVSYRLSLPFGQ